MLNNKNTSQKRSLAIIGIFQCIVFALANVILVNISYQLIIMRYLRRHFSIEFYNLLPQILWLFVLLAASVVNGAMISDKWRSFVSMNSFLKAAIMSVPNIFIVLNAFLHNQYLQANLLLLIALMIIFPLIIFFTVFEAIKYFDDLKSESLIYSLFFTNPIIYLLSFLLLFFVLTPFFKLLV